MSQSNATYLESHVLRRFNIIKKVGSGAYGHVWKVQEKLTKKIYALKKIFDAFQHATDAQRTYREIEILKQTDHPNVIKLYDTLKADNNKDVYLVFEFMEADLHNVISEDILKDVHIRFILYQMAKALKYLHTGYVIHRDLKPSNILVNSNCTIKLCDFGLVRSIESLTESNPILTEGVATRWYRAPEVLLGSKSYSTPADVWSFGCIIFQILAQKPLFAGSSTLDQLQKICQFTGYPSEEDIKSIDSQMSKSMLKQLKHHNQSQSQSILKEIPGGFRDIVERMIAFNPKKRITIEEILNHDVVKAFHKSEEEVACDKQIKTSIDDNKKLTVEEYRKLIYGAASNAPTSGVGSSISTSASKNSISATNTNTIIKSSSAKYIKKPSDHSQTGNQGPSHLSKTLNDNGKQHHELSKKYSYDNLKNLNKSVNEHQKSNSMHGNDVTNGSSANKRPQKQTLKYVRSAKDFLRNGSSDHVVATRQQNYLKKNSENGNNKSCSSLGNYAEENNREEMPTKGQQGSNSLHANKSYTSLNRPTYVSKTFYSPKNHLEPTKSSSGHGLGSSSGNNLWGSSNSTKAFLNKEVKEKTYLFKSQKYIRDFKGGNDTSVLGKREENASQNH